MSRCFDRVERGEMPPASEAAPIEESRLTAMALLKAELKRVNRRSQQTIGRVPSRRLSRHEYEHTLHDFVASVRIPLRAILVSPQLLFQTGEAARIRSAVPRSEYGERVVASSCHDKDPPRRRAQR